MKFCLWFLPLVLLHPAFAQERTTKPAAARAVNLQQVATPVLQQSQVDKSRVVSGELKTAAVMILKSGDSKSKLPAEFEKGEVVAVGEGFSQFILKPKTIETRVINSAEVVDLPGVAVKMSGGNPAASGSDDGLEVINLTYFASPSPAVWDLQNERYSTKVTFGLKSSKGSKSDFILPDPVEVRVAFEGLAGEEPQPMFIDGMGIAAEKSFSLDFKPTTAEPKLLVRSTISDVNLQLDLSAVSRLSLQSSRQEVLGFGLEKASFSVRDFLPHGEPVQLEAAIPIAVTVSGRGSLSPEQPTFAPGIAVSQFDVRSSGLGEMVVEARVGDSLAVATVTQRFPWGPLIAVLLGGALGGFARKFVKGAASSRVPLWIVEGLVVSLIAFVAGVLGVGNLGIPSAIVATEAGAFLTGALSGFVGVVVLEKLTASFRAKPE